ncbi:MAG: UDP-N-acetylmuramoyl-L-alanine--D-glutamate ligase [Candidatus Rokuibacteriota bacterium]|nr:MAG: UDP-N-acetylmuramoyl-L-alanine--D-glutamate ligase [Candidatus Rokubacteria bacterium]
MSLPGRVLVLGLGRSGQAASAALAHRGVDVVGADSKLGNDGQVSLLDGVELLVKSPGVPRAHPLVEEAAKRRIPVWAEVELGYRLLPGSRFVGVTGTNGKTTTVELLGAMFREAGREVAVAGNVGRPLSAIEPTDWVVCELSSFQLEDVHELACEVAVLLNLEPDHLDRHGSMEAYREAKLRIFERATIRVVPRNSDLEGLQFSAGDPLPAEPLMPGLHNRENAAAATVAARAAGIGDKPIARALTGFPGVPHRLELVSEAQGVRYVNDSKATNIAAARRALQAYEQEAVHLIAGGRGKGEPFGELAEEMGPNVRGVYVIGESADKIAAAVGERAVLAGNLARAVELASRAARPGEVVLLSPACASYDQYENFEQRGEEFRRLAQNLAT